MVIVSNRVFLHREGSYNAGIYWNNSMSLRVVIVRPVYTVSSIVEVCMCVCVCPGLRVVGMVGVVTVGGESGNGCVMKVLGTV